MSKLIKKNSFGNKTNARLNKSAIFAVALMLALSIGSFAVCMPFGFAQTKITSTAFISLRPNPIGIHQELLVNAWISPTPPFASEPNAFGIAPGAPRSGLTFTFTKPDGSTTTVVKETTGEGATWFVYRPDQIGTWTLQLAWAGDDQFTSCTTEKQPFTVQQEQVPSWPATEDPTGSLDFPISPQNRDWAEMAGGWFQPTGGQGLGYDSSGSRSNPYTKAPNTAHVLWKLQPISGLAGLVSEPYGQTSFFTANKASVGVVMYGRGYISGADGKIHCVNTTTGQELWTAPGSFTLGCVEYVPPIFSFVSGTYYPMLYQIGSDFIKYDAITGAILVNMTMGPSVWGPAAGPFAPNPDYLGFEQPYAFIRQDLGGKYYLIKFDTTGTTTNLKQRIKWNVTFPDGVRQPTGYTDIGVAINNGILVYFHFPVYGKSCGISTADGSTLWCHNIDGVEQKPESITSGNGKFYLDEINMHFQAFDMATGNRVWESPKLTEGYPWSAFWSYGQAVSYNTLYALSYAGAYAFDTVTGQVKWKYSAGYSGNEEPYGTWPFGSADPFVADGKVFAPSTEHTPQFYYRGNQLYVLDATNGKRIWNILGYWTLNAIAEGRLFATNEFDGCSYAFGKGPTQTSVSVTSPQIGKGDSVGISGSVLDMSPAQPGTPCVSKDSMTAQMENLHMQQPLPTGTTNYPYYPDGWPIDTIKGVPVALTATKSDGSKISIGQTNTDTNGKFVYQWTPPDQAAYTISASFTGDDSYYSSSESTALNVGPISGTASNTDTIIIIAAIVIIIVVVAVAMLSKRK
jgi:outer membrane protein assembly factor BamB